MKEIRIGILECLWHELFLSTLSLLSLGSGNTVTIFTNKKIFNNIKTHLGEEINKIQFVLKDESESRIKFFYRVNRICRKKIDLLFVNTIQGTHDIPHFLFLNPNCNKILGTARYGEWFKTKYKPINSLENIKHNYRQVLRNIIKQRYDGYFVHTENEKKYLAEHNHKKNIFAIPYVISDFPKKNKEISNTSQDKVRFTIPGSIDPSRRNYKIIFDAIESNLFDDKSKFIITLLGRPIKEYGDSVLDKAEELKDEGFEIEWFEKYIEESLYTNFLKKTDVLISPINPEHYPNGGYTAAVVEAIRFGLPILFSRGYEVIEDLRPISFYFSNYKELYNMMMRFLSNEYLTKNKERAKKIVKRNFSRENFSHIITDIYAKVSQY